MRHQYQQLPKVSKRILTQAAQHGLIENDQIGPLYDFIARNQQSVAASDSRAEPLRFIRSFGDVFITLGILLLAYATTLMNLTGFMQLLPALAFLGIAEWLVRIRKLTLPGMAILLVILFLLYRTLSTAASLDSSLQIGLLSLASLLFYLRYRLPFALMPLVAGIIAVIFLSIGLDLFNQPLIISAIGVVVFVIAMLFDAQDTGRLSYLSDNAFWLHLLAAPLMVHGAIVSLLLNDYHWVDALGRELLMIIFFTLFFLLALLVDRRALLISTQAYVIYALTRLLSSQLSNSETLVMLVLMGLGLFVIFFGSYWYLARRLIFGFMAPGRLAKWLPDFNVKDHPGPLQ